jgi:hypothetical protein
MPAKLKKPSKRILNLQERIAKAKILAARRITRQPEQTLEQRFFPAKTTVPAEHFTVTAKMTGGLGEFLARVPVVVNPIPEIPDVVTLEGKVWLLTNTAPLTYIHRASSEATRV